MLLGEFDLNGIYRDLDSFNALNFYVMLKIVLGSLLFYQRHIFIYVFENILRKENWFVNKYPYLVKYNR